VSGLGDGTLTFTDCGAEGGCCEEAAEEEVEAAVVRRGEGEKREASMVMVDLDDVPLWWFARDFVWFCVTERIGEIGVAYPVRATMHSTTPRRGLVLSLYAERNAACMGLAQ
jgi:hypothetical protein